MKSKPGVKTNRVKEVLPLRRSRRSPKPTSHFFATFQYSSGEVEHQIVEQCGLEQPNPNAGAEKESDLSRLGTEAWFDLKKSPDKWRAERRAAGYRFYLTNKPKVEGITLFSGYETLGKAYKESGMDITKITERARNYRDVGNAHAEVGTEASSSPTFSYQTQGDAPESVSVLSIPESGSQSNTAESSTVARLESIETTLNSLMSLVQDLAQAQSTGRPRA